MHILLSVHILYLFQVKRTGGFFSRDVLMPFQGIFCRYPTAPFQQQSQLKIEKSVIQPQMVWSGIISRGNIATDCQHLFETIANNTANGGRLICIELTGQEQIQGGFGINSRMPSKNNELYKHKHNNTLKWTSPGTKVK